MQTNLGPSALKNKTTFYGQTEILFLENTEYVKVPLTVYRRLT